MFLPDRSSELATTTSTADYAHSEGADRRLSRSAALGTLSARKGSLTTRQTPAFTVARFPSHEVRIYLASAGMDSNVERNFLQATAFFNLREKCRHFGFSLAVHDLRLGMPALNQEETLDAELWQNSMRECIQDFSSRIELDHWLHPKDLPPSYANFLVCSSILWNFQITDN